MNVRWRSLISSKNHWPFFVIVALIIALILVVVLSGSKNTMNADEVRSQAGQVTHLATPIKAALAEPLIAGSVVCPRDHTHGYPVCATCKKIMQPHGNGLFFCPECGQIGLPICPTCGQLIR